MNNPTKKQTFYTFVPRNKYRNSEKKKKSITNLT